VKGDPGMVSALATRLLGSPDLYAHHGGEPARSLNFITSHDGFTLADVVSYNHKHNEPNGEHHRDGPHENYSWNCGEEGPSTSPEVCRLRRRQMKNMVALLLLAQGVPMLLSGDEMGRTQHGNNNAYCHDNEHSWVNWGALEQHTDTWRFFKRLIRFRKCHPVLRQRRFLATAPSQMPAVTWHGCRLGQPDWSWASRSLAMHVSSGNADVDLYLLANAYWESLRFELPTPSGLKQWYRFIDTQRRPPDEIYQEDDMPLLTTPSHYDVGPRTVVVLVGK
jgi:glycogen operon protein